MHASIGVKSFQIRHVLAVVLVCAIGFAIWNLIRRTPATLEVTRVRSQNGRTLVSYAIAHSAGVSGGSLEIRALAESAKVAKLKELEGIKMTIRCRLKNRLWFESDRHEIAEQAILDRVLTFADK